MSCACELGFGRIVRVNKLFDRIRIIEQASGKFVKFSPARRAVLQLHLMEIDSALQKAMLENNVRYKWHLGGGWFVSVTSGFR